MEPYEQIVIGMEGLVKNLLWNVGHTVSMFLPG